MPTLAQRRISAGGFTGRLKLVTKLLQRELLTLDVGSKETNLGDIKIEVDRNVRPTVVADCAHLPIREGIFEQVIFTDVLEHVPPGCELAVLTEINTVMKRGGKLILSTPSNRPLFKLLDPALYFIGHRHYGQNQVASYLVKSGFKLARLFSSGHIYACIANLFSNRWLLALLPQWLEDKVDREYDQIWLQGYTIFCTAYKS